MAAILAPRQHSNDKEQETNQYFIPGNAFLKKTGCKDWQIIKNTWIPHTAQYKVAAQKPSSIIHLH